MKRALLLLVMVVGVAVAEDVAEPKSALTGSESRTFFGIFDIFDPFKALLQIGAEIVILVALVLLISTLKKAQDGGAGGYDYEYYHVPTGYESSGTGSSYSGYSKRSVDNLSTFMNHPIAQRLAERVHQAIESYSV